MGIYSKDSPLTLALSSTFIAEPIKPALAFWFEELNLPARIDFAPYNQPFQQLLDQSSVLSTNTNGINITLVRLEDWRVSGVDGKTSDTNSIDWQGDLKQKVSDFVVAVMTAAKRSATPHVVVSCPCSALAHREPEYSIFLEQLESVLGEPLTSVSGVEFVGSKDLMSAYNVHAYDDPESEQLAHIPYTSRFFTALASVIARCVYSLTQTDYKAVAVDCDQVLWTGICGEDGALGVEIDANRQAIQEYLLQLYAKGVLVCLCSRNNEEDVLDVFYRRSEMRLKPEHIVASKLNWKLKSENIKALASELQLTPDAFVFLDDDPVECAEVQANCPETLTIQLPNRAESIPKFLNNLWIFRRAKITDEARQRTAFYQANLERRLMLQSAPTLGDFLARLDLKISLMSIIPRYLARASELTHRTNQFNATSIKRSEAEIDALLQQGAVCFVVHVRDRFGDYGLVGLVICSATSDAISVDTFLLSCRALGRGVEHRMIVKLGVFAEQQGLARVDVHFVPNGRNRPMLDFLRATVGRFEEAHGLGSVFRIPTPIAKELRYCPDGGGDAQNAAATSIEGTPTPNKEIVAPRFAAANNRPKAALLSSIARELSDVDHIHALVCARTRTRPDIGRPYVAPRTPIEERITAILAEVLGLDRVGVEDNFFEIGGHSLLGIQVLFKIRDAFEMELSVRLMYSGAFTAAELARKVVQLQLQTAGAPKITALIERVDKLSDDEVRMLLTSVPHVRDSGSGSV